MYIKWYGHSSFRISGDDGIKVILDPYNPSGYAGSFSYGKITDPADIVCISHDHADHNFANGIAGNPIIVKTPCAQVIKGVKIEGLPAYHDKSKGKERGKNIVYCIQIDNIRVCHLGDLGHLLSAKDVEYLKPIDVLLVPVGGHYTIDAAEAAKIVDMLNPKIVIPMHYKTPKCEFPLALVDDFTKTQATVKTIKQKEIYLEKATLPNSRETWILPFVN